VQPLGKSRGTKGDKGDIRPENSNVVFFCFVLADLVTIALCYVNKFSAVPNDERLTQATVLVMLMSAAYSSSDLSELCQPWMAAVMGAISALAFCLVTIGWLEGRRDNLNILPVLMLAVPIQFLISACASGGARIKRENIRLKAQALTTLASLAAATGITIWIVFA
jgi:hypothetical protein